MAWGNTKFVEKPTLVDALLRGCLALFSTFCFWFLVFIYSFLKSHFFLHFSRYKYILALFQQKIKAPFGSTEIDFRKSISGKSRVWLCCKIRSSWKHFQFDRKISLKRLKLVSVLIFTLIDFLPSLTRINLSHMHCSVKPSLLCQAFTAPEPPTPTHHDHDLAGHRNCADRRRSRSSKSARLRSRSRRSRAKRRSTLRARSRSQSR